MNNEIEGHNIDEESTTKTTTKKKSNTKPVMVSKTTHKALTTILNSINKQAGNKRTKFDTIINQLLEHFTKDDLDYLVDQSKNVFDKEDEAMKEYISKNGKTDPERIKELMLKAFQEKYLDRRDVVQ